MASTRELRLRVRSIKNLSQVTKALETVSASYVRRAVQANAATQPYAEKAWKVLLHLVRQPGHNNLHPLLAKRAEVKNILVVMISADRGLAGAYNQNILRATLQRFSGAGVPVSYVTVGRKGRDLLLRRGQKVIAEFSNLPVPPTYADVSAIGRIVVDDFVQKKYDQVYIAYTQFTNRAVQKPVIRKLLPLEVVYSPDPNDHEPNVTHHQSNSVFTYEPDSANLLDEIVPRFTAMQIFQAVLSSQASEHSARMTAMHNATENAKDLIAALQMEYNKLRQSIITSDILDIISGANALEI